MVTHIHSNYHQSAISDHKITSGSNHALGTF